MAELEIKEKVKEFKTFLKNENKTRKVYFTKIRDNDWLPMMFLKDSPHAKSFGTIKYLIYGEDDKTITYIYKV